MKTRYRLGVDVGGTHTDLVLLDMLSGDFIVEKVSTTPNNPAEGVQNGIAKLVARGFKAQDIEFFAHGTTITTNALLELRGAKVGLLITKGFRAIQEVQNQARDTTLFDYFYKKPSPIAPQSLTKEISERSDFSGQILMQLDEEAVRRAARDLKAANVESIAVCYLFSFMNQGHELRTREILHEEYPGVSVSLSSEILPRIREWARMSTTLLNAYLEPVLVRYISFLNKGLDEIGVVTSQRFLMQSNGGVMPFSSVMAGGKSVHTLLSGPAAGAKASAYLAEETAKNGLVTVDMGGTSADIAFIDGGVPLEVTEGVIARRQVDVPSLDMTTISAGGGSIAWVDDAGFLNIGPQSAGAVPGPACYGRGGTRATVTDADLICGYINPEYFLGGSQTLSIEAAKLAIATDVAKPLNLSLHHAAAGVRHIVDMKMADEVRVFAARRGVDLTNFTLLPFGGAGAVHAVAVAEELGMKRILVPARPGAFSALGLLCTDVVHDHIRSDLKPLEMISADFAEKIYQELQHKAVEDLINEGLDPEKASFSREIDLRYTGQGYELRTSLDGLFTGALSSQSLSAVRNRFDELHEKIHGHSAANRSVEVVSYRLRVSVQVPKYQHKTQGAKPKDMGNAKKGERLIYPRGEDAQHAVVYERERLWVGDSFKGPAIIEQFDATTVIPMGWKASVDAHLNLILEHV
ncbi:MAG: hydantoinase/oxoprolinase family protein [Betaproteobacteria bacterium]